MSAAENLASLPLDDRVAGALKTPVEKITSIEVSAIIAEASDEKDRLEAIKATEEVNALSPLVGSKDAEAARSRAIELQFKIDRMNNSLALLEQKLTEVEKYEEGEEHARRVTAALEERDRCAAMLETLWPRLEDVAKLMHEIVTNDAELKAVNQYNRQSVDIVARGWDREQTQIAYRELQNLTATLVIPSWTPGGKPLFRKGKV